MFWRKNVYRLMAWKTQTERLLGMRDVNYMEDLEVGTAYLKGSSEKKMAALGSEKSGSD